MPPTSVACVTSWQRRACSISRPSSNNETSSRNGSKRDSPPPPPPPPRRLVPPPPPPPPVAVVVPLLPPVATPMRSEHEFSLVRCTAWHGSHSRFTDSFTWPLPTYTRTVPQSPLVPPSTLLPPPFYPPATLLPSSLRPPTTLLPSSPRPFSISLPISLPPPPQLPTPPPAFRVERCSGSAQSGDGSSSTRQDQGVDGGTDQATG